MPTPPDDDLRTIGLPRGAAADIVKRLESLNRPGADTSGAEARPPARPVLAPSAKARPGESDILATNAPPRGLTGRDARRRTGPLAHDDGPLRPAADDARARTAPATPEAKSPARPLPSDERPLDDFQTVGLPPGVRPRAAPSAPGRPSPAEEVPFPAEESLYFPLTPVPADSTKTPCRFPGPEVRAPLSPQAPPPRPAARPVERRAPEPEAAIDRTIGVSGLKPAAAGTTSILQFFDRELGRWSDLGNVDRDGKIVGRDTFRAWTAEPDSLAKAHLEIAFDGNELYIDPLPSLNGAYRKLRPNLREPLAPGGRFRIGRHVLEFRLAGPPVAVVPARAGDGEVLQSRVLTPLGFVDLIGPDGRAYLSFPLTRQSDRVTTIGRTGASCDIALTGDEWVSQRHASLWFNDGACWLEDLGSTNGTFLKLNGRTSVRRGSARQPETGDELLIGGYVLRVIDV